MKKPLVTHSSNKKYLHKIFETGCESNIFYANHNPFLKTTEYEIHISDDTKNHYTYAKRRWELYITIQWAENGYKQKTLENLASMIKRDFPHYLI